MTALETPPVTRSRRIPAIVAGTLVVISAGAILAGSALLGIHATKRDGHGYYSTSPVPAKSSTSALVIRNIDFDAPRWALENGRFGTLQLTATATGGQPLFIGIAPRDDVDDYLAGVDYDEVTDLDTDPSEITTEHHAGTHAALPPQRSDIWDERRNGSGEQRLPWTPRSGEWAAVIMNADGSPGVSAKLSVGVRLEWLPWLGAGFLVVGFAAGLGAARALAVARRRRSAQAGRSTDGQAVSGHASG